MEENTKKPTAKLGAMAEKLYPVYKKNKKVTKEDVIKAIPSDTNGLLKQLIKVVFL